MLAVLWSGACGASEPPVTPPGTGPVSLNPRLDSITLHYDRPANQWESEALPVGNGRMGAMLFGGSTVSRTQFNVDTMWSGDENPGGEYATGTFGYYEAFGDLYLELAGAEARPGQYRRELELARGVHSERWQDAAGSVFRSETFVSYPAQVLVTRWVATGATKLRGSVRLAGMHNERTRARGARGSEPATLSFSGALSNGLQYLAVSHVVPEGCQATPADDRVTFTGCGAVSIYLAADTNYAADRKQGWRGPDPRPRVEGWLNAARAAGWDALLKAHIADHQSLYGRVSIDLGQSAPNVRAQTTDQRIAQYVPMRDPDLIEALFQYGRYLLMASSRGKGMPANLQGLWNASNTPPWHSDYHSNINLQMNYWPAEPANLPECHLPLFNMLDATQGPARDATRAAFGPTVPGFTYRTSHNIYGGQGWKWNKPASAWYASHYWEHYAFSGDREFLRQRAWPYLREVSAFWLHMLKERPDGKLVVPNGWSPEHGPVEDGVTYDQSLVWGVFTDTMEAGRALGLTTDPILMRVARARDRLLAPKIGSWGQLQEWAVDRDRKGDRHRHTSHLVGVYPGRQINRLTTPALARAAEVSLRGRAETGDSRRSWTWPWRCALWARLGTLDCTRMLDGLITYNTLSNLITDHPPLQLDGNFGITGALSEVLLQSHAGEVELLPAVDFARWPDGHFNGLRARTALQVSATWNGGRIVRAGLLPERTGPVTLRAPSSVARITGAGGGVVPFTSVGKGVVRFDAIAGEVYSLGFP